MNTALFSAAMGELDDRYLELALREQPRRKVQPWHKCAQLPPACA